MTSKTDLLKKAVAVLPARAGADLRMEDLLDPAIAALPELLADKTLWQSLYIDYEPPFLMRLSIPVCADDKKVFINLHYFFGVPGAGASDAAGLPNPYAARPDLVNQDGANNYHPHPWATAFEILSGSYKQDIGLAKERGYSSDPVSPLRPAPHDTWEQDGADPAKNRYAFNNPLQWHRVLPNNGQPVTSIMITYVPEGWDQTGPKPTQKQRPLNDNERDFMFLHFREFFKPEAAAEPAPQKRKFQR